jgi:hypothetical protein
MATSVRQRPRRRIKLSDLPKPNVHRKLSDERVLEAE